MTKSLALVSVALGLVAVASAAIATPFVNQFSLYDVQNLIDPMYLDLAKQHVLPEVQRAAEDLFSGLTR